MDMSPENTSAAPFSVEPRHAPNTLKGLKREAKKLKRATGCKHANALEMVARSLGFASYHAAQKALPDGGAK